MTLAEFEGNSLIGFMSEAMCSFLGATVEDYPNQGAIHWLNSVCDPECVREAASTPMADHSIRKWTHKKLYLNDGITFECLVQGHILPSAEIMFVEIVILSTNTGVVCSRPFSLGRL